MLWCLAFGWFFYFMCFWPFCWLWAFGRFCDVGWWLGVGLLAGFFILAAVGSLGGFALAPAPLHPPSRCVWRLLRRTILGHSYPCSSGSGSAWDSTSQPSSTLSTVAILAQGTNWAGALLRAFFCSQRWRQTLQRGKPGSVTLQLLSLRAWLDSLA